MSALALHNSSCTVSSQINYRATEAGSTLPVRQWQCNTSVCGSVWMGNKVAHWDRVNLSEMRRSQKHCMTVDHVCMCMCLCVRVCVCLTVVVLGNLCIAVKLE